MKQLSAKEVRRLFLDFFREKGHHIMDSAPIVVQNDPTLFFINAGMNPFKDYFIGNRVSPYPRIADTQKCLRVSGKHNDIEEVGKDHYHHTMFEMLGNWSFRDYFKKEAIAWAWEFITERCGIDKERLYVSVFEGNKEEGIDEDKESVALWRNFLPQDKIIKGNKKDNFWEMGDTGPCGPCSEIHIDLRSDEERAKVPGASLVNKDHPEVIEIWNIVFIQYERKQDKKLQPLSHNYIDTGMGLERLARVLGGKKSNYDTDLFAPLIARIEKITGEKYTASDSKKDIAFRVLADHIRAISFAIADGRLPSNIGAGYVIRRILRRAVRYYFNFLDYKTSLLWQLVETLAGEMGDVFPELKQVAYLEKIIREEEESFLHTLQNGLKRFQAAMEKEKETKKISGQTLFELYDTYGFPLDLSLLIAAENGYAADEKGFEEELNKQKNRSRSATRHESDDWIVFDNQESRFVGYAADTADTRILKYRKATQNKKSFFQIVLADTPFYAESGGQAGDSGLLLHPTKNLSIEIIDTVKENDTFLHHSETEPIADIWKTPIRASIDLPKRLQHASHHSATHLLHAALHSVIGKEATQKGSLVNEEKIRFDFVHGHALTMEEIEKIEEIVNDKIRQNIPVEVLHLPKKEAIARGAMALFNEKYGDVVRTVIMDECFSIELCGGTHVKHTGEIGSFKIVSQSAVASGVRRVEAIAGKAMTRWMQEQYKELRQAKAIAKTNDSIVPFLERQQKQIKELQQKADDMEKRLIAYQAKDILSRELSEAGEIRYVIADKGNQIESVKFLRSLAQETATQTHFCFLIARIDNKTHIAFYKNKNAPLQVDWNAIFRNYILSKAGMNGGGSGDAFLFATAEPINVPSLINELQTAIKETLG